MGKNSAGFAPYSLVLGTPLWSSIHWYALLSSPPSQPQLPSGHEQSMSACSESDSRMPVVANKWPSSAATVPKAQHEPHLRYVEGTIDADRGSRARALQ